MITRRRVARGGQALAQLTVAAAVVGGVVWAAEQPAVTARIDALDVARETREARPLESTTVALQSSSVLCAGPELIGLAGARELELPTAATAVAAPLADLGEIPQPTGESELSIMPSATAAGAGGTADPAAGSGPVSVPLSAPDAYLATGRGAAAPALVATQETRAATDEVTGLATAPCQIAAPEAWVIGGGGGPGRAERLVLANPGSNAVTVDITAFGAEGMSEPPAGQGVAVPANGRTVLLGDALLPDEASPVFLVRSSGGDVTAALVETAIDGTRPVGFDIVAAAAPAAQVQTIAGVLVPEEGQGSVTVRIANPGDAEAIATISHLAEDGELALPEGVARVPAGSVIDVPVTEVPAGVTTLGVTADSPVVAAARTVVDTGGAADATWAVSQTAVADVAGAALPGLADVSRRLVVSSAGGDAQIAVAELNDGAASTSQMRVPSGGTVVLPAAGDGIWLRQVSGSGSVTGAVVSVSTAESMTEVSSMPLTAPPTSARRSEVVALP